MDKQFVDLCRCGNLGLDMLIFWITCDTALCELFPGNHMMHRRSQTTQPWFVPTADPFFSSSRATHFWGMDESITSEEITRNKVTLSSVIRCDLFSSTDCTLSNTANPQIYRCWFAAHNLSKCFTAQMPSRLCQGKKVLCYSVSLINSF